MIWSSSHHNTLFPLFPSNIHLNNVPKRNAPAVRVSTPIKKREQERKAVVINEDTVHCADGNGNGDAKVGQKRPVKRGKSESANGKPRTKRMKELSRRKRLEVIMCVLIGQLLACCVRAADIFILYVEGRLELMS